MAEETYLIAGLGNPGVKYELTRHNIGFQVVEDFAKHLQVSLDSEKWNALFCRTSLQRKKIFLIKPQAFMNLSGQTVAKFAAYFKIQPQNILIIHDDLDMHPGRLKLVATGGPGGHNGIKSIINYLGTKDFCRLKIGIGRPGQNGVHKEMLVEHFVLAPFSSDERKIIEKRQKILLEGIEAFLFLGREKAMNLLNGVK